MTDKNKELISYEKGLSEGNQCMAIGAGVGGLGAAATLAFGAICPLCFFVAPALVGVGLVKRILEKRKLSKNTKSTISQEIGS